ncbi:MAG: glycosyl hydrolase family 28-related protein [Alphaproteobacteria bacterium]|nr:glycosyl hydrolase family 28-related protein [Alphaproteobacteria bacterium]
MTEHIKMPDVVPIIRYLADGVRVNFEYPFPVFASEDLKIYFDGAAQISGFTIYGAGEGAGGSVTFDVAPANGVVVTLERRMVFERLSDFIEGGDFSAAAINTELDFLVGGLQQISRDQSPMLRYDTGESPSSTVLPARNIRAGKALGFDGNGDPVAVSLAGSMAAPDFTAVGTGSVTRTSHDKFSDFVSVKDFGAVGDGLSDDTIAFQQALSAHDFVFVPSGHYIVNGTIEISSGKVLTGAGDSALIETSLSIPLIRISGSYARLALLKLFGGDIGIQFLAADTPCVQNAVTDVSIWQAQTGIVLDGGSDGSKPTYWNNFTRVLVAQPFVHGIHLMRSGAGDTPNANRFSQCRVYSLGATTSGAGVYIEEGSFNNSFTDLEVNVNGTAQACVRCGAGSNKSLFVNLYTESFNSVPNVRLDAGSIETAIYNLLSASDGAAIWDLSGGQYSAFNAGYPYKNRLQRTICTDLTATLQRFDTEYIDASGAVTLDLSHTVHLVSSYGGALDVALPNASGAAGAMIVVKKIDTSKNIITVTESGGDGPDRKSYYLGGQYDFVTMMSNGAEWFVISTNRAPGNTRYYDGSGTYDIDMAVDVYLLSSYGGALTARLPPADAAEAAGRKVTIKKTDVSGNAVNITENGGSGPDQYTQSLTAQNQAITVVSDGGQWYIVSRF